MTNVTLFVICRTSEATLTASFTDRLCKSTVDVLYGQSGFLQIN